MTRAQEEEWAALGGGRGVVGYGLMGWRGWGRVGGCEKRGEERER